MRTWMFAAALVLVAAGASAADYGVDPEHTRVTFEVKHLGFSTFRGSFDQITGKIAYDPAAKAGSADIKVEVASANTGVDELDQHLQTADFFDAAKHPTITFKSKSFNFEGERLKSVDGDLTMRGTTRPVRLEVLAVNCGPHPVAKFEVCGADAQVKLKRSDYGVSYGVPAVGDEVLLRIGVESQNKPK